MRRRGSAHSRRRDAHGHDTLRQPDGLDHDGRREPRQLGRRAAGADRYHSHHHRCSDRQRHDRVLTNDSTTTPAEGARFNVRMLREEDGADGSHGVHNPFLAEALLRANIEELVAVYPGLPAPPAVIREILRGPLGAVDQAPNCGAADLAPGLVSLGTPPAHGRRLLVCHTVGGGLVTSRSRPPSPGLPVPSVHRLGERGVPPPRPTGAHRPVDLPEAGLGHGGGDRARAPSWRSRRCSSCGGAGCDPDLARHPGTRSQAGPGRSSRRHAPADRRHGCQSVRLHDARQRLLPRAATSSCPAANCSCVRTPGPTSWSTSWRASTTPCPVMPATRSRSRPRPGSSSPG